MTQKRSITYAGHSACFVQLGGMTVAIDPWLEGNPLCPVALITPPPTDLIVLTHGHADHASDAVRVARATGAKLAATYELAMIMINEGVSADVVIPMNKGGTVRVGDVDVTLTHAIHSNSFDGSSGTVYAGEACGVALRSGGWSLYHAGDTSLFAEMERMGRDAPPDVALLPIGDRFTMGPREAAEAASLLRCKLAIPIHYKTFPLLTGTYDAFARFAAELGVATRELEPGMTVAM
jgi:L-ascorbate metabolism protein UlaG (beta-lactamase superfamily)